MHWFLRVLLSPFTLLWYLGSRFRNHLFDIGYKTVVEFTIPTITVGNLTVGGTGKTPMIEYLIRLLSSDYQLATLSRGYGRRSKGFLLASEKENATTLGDEPCQLHRKFGEAITVAVCEDRVYGIPCILMERPDVNLVLLDDAMQHRPAGVDITVMLSDYHRPFYTDWVLPSGRLREPRSGAKRADIIVVTKCPPGIDAQECAAIESEIRRYARQETPVFFAWQEYDAVTPFGESREQKTPERVLLVTGIARADSMLAYVREHFDLAEHMEYSDHYHYRLADVEQIRKRAEELGAAVLCTEKDAVKLGVGDFAAAWGETSCWYLPMRVQMGDAGANFDTIIRNSLHKAIETKD